MLLDRIALFVNVAKHQNLAKTARGMHVSSSAVSQRLKSLERDFGVKLYKRNKTGIELTNEGRLLLTTASQVLNQLDTLRKTLNPDSEKPVQRLSVGGTYNTSAKYLPSAIATFQKIHPEIQVTFLTSHGRAVENWIRDGELDIAIVQSPSESCIAELYTEYFAMDNLAFFACAGHPLTKKQKISLEDLANTPLIVRAGGTGATQRILTLLESRSFKLNVALRCASPDAVKAAVRRKMGVGILFHNLIEDDIRRKELKILRVPGLPRMSGTSYIVYDKTKPLKHPAAEFLAILHDMKSRQKNPIVVRNLTGTDQS